MKIPSAAKTVELGDWEALVVPVPPTASYRWRKQKVELPSKPSKPMATYDSIAGHTETVEALPESKEYDAWLKEMIKWDEECTEVLQDKAVEGNEFAFDYAVLAWRNADETGAVNEWMTEPPEDWELSQAYSRHDIEVSSNLRLEFILHELICVSEYMEKVNAVMYPTQLGTESDASEITREEVAAAVATFQPRDEIPRATGRVGTATRRGRKQGQYQNVKHGASITNSRQKRYRPSWLVRLAKRFADSDNGSE